MEIVASRAKAVSGKRAALAPPPRSSRPETQAGGGVEVDIERHPTRSRSSELEGLEAAMPPMPHCTQLVNLRWLAALISLAKGSMISIDDRRQLFNDR